MTTHKNVISQIKGQRENIQGKEKGKKIRWFGGRSRGLVWHNPKTRRWLFRSSVRIEALLKFRCCVTHVVISKAFYYSGYVLFSSVFRWTPISKQLGNKFAYFWHSSANSQKKGAPSQEDQIHIIVIYVILKLNASSSIQIICAYAPTFRSKMRN